MPVILPEEHYEVWLDPARSQAELTELVRPLPNEAVVAYPVPQRVNKTKNDGPDLVDPVGDPLSGEGESTVTQPGFGL